MRNLLRVLLLTFVAAMLTVSCSKEEEYQEPQLEVTPNNIAGWWTLESYDNGVTLAEGSYVYIEFVRADRTFTIRQNLDSTAEREITGSYYIDTDMELGAVIRGQYDYGVGDWSHRYVVKSLTANKMIWVAKDDPANVSVYVRANITNE